ncbi:MAG: class I SAM-dependent methyltransferase [Chloroflexota bacterium]|nr:class I SAM-dependent methyltransferase [Chloroflexota bacterium]
MTGLTFNTFDELATSFDAQRGLPRAALAALARLIEDIADGGNLRVVEPGIGTGRVAIAALAGGHHVVGVDRSRPMLRELQVKLDRVASPHLHVSLVEGDALALPFAEATFDLGILASVLYLIDDWQTALDELFRVIEPGGTVLVVVERSVERPALARWDALWREAIERTGYRHAPMDPDDEALLREVRSLADGVEERTLHTWTIGRTVAEARDGIAALRPLYPSIGQESWDAAASGFAAATEWEFPDPAARLDCDVHLDVAICRLSGRR